jgi:hypothetical protein
MVGVSVICTLDVRFCGGECKMNGSGEMVILFLGGWVLLVLWMLDSVEESVKLMVVVRW